MKITKTNFTYDDFPVGTNVQIVSEAVDFNFFFGETGVIEKNTGEYLGIRVRFHTPRCFKDGTMQYDFNFKPENLKPIDLIQSCLDYDIPLETLLSNTIHTWYHDHIVHYGLNKTNHNILIQRILELVQQKHLTGETHETIAKMVR